MEVNDNSASFHKTLGDIVKDRRFIVGTIILVCVIFTGMKSNNGRSISTVIELFASNSRTLCFKRQTADSQTPTSNECPHDKNVLSLLWTHQGSGIMKYIQWVVTRKLGNIKMTHLNDNCQVIHENDFSSIFNQTSNYVHVYFVSLTANFQPASNCFVELDRMIKSAHRRINQIYFKRQSIQATLLYQRLDSIKLQRSLSFEWNRSDLDKIQKKAHATTTHLLTYFTNSEKNKTRVIEAEQMIHSSLIDCERSLMDLMISLGFDTSSSKWNTIIQYDSHQFIQDATWWDQSNTIDLIYNRSEQLNASNSIHDFFRLGGRRSLVQYLLDNRQCFYDGVFPQLPSETMPNRTSTDNPERCSTKKFDCLFSDLYSFADREQMYQSYDVQNYFYQKPIKCAFAVHSILDKIRQRYARNQTCETIFFTCITHCYDPLPIIRGQLPMRSCFVALLDRQTIDAYEKYYATRTKSENPNVHWDMIDLETSGSLFRVPPKLTELLKTLGHRLFPLAKWIIWLDGKAHVSDFGDLVAQTRAPILGPYHPESRTPESEVEPTVMWMTHRGIGNLERLRITVHEIELQQAQYRRDGFYTRAAALGLRIYDIATLIYRNHHPCLARYFCGWHNEVNYYSFRGQLSLYYSAVRLNLTDYFNFMPAKSFSGSNHQPVC